MNVRVNRSGALTRAVDVPNVIECLPPVEREHAATRGNASSPNTEEFFLGVETGAGAIAVVIQPLSRIR
jgi:hypothetical protein